MLGKLFRRWTATPLLALFALALTLALDFLPHTDDGCETEIHCIACRATLGGAAVVTALAAPIPALATAGAPAVAALVEVGEAYVAGTWSRGPPSLPC